MTLSLAHLNRLLAPRPTRFYDRIDSTQEMALEWLREGAEAGAVVIANEQLKGRGRQGRMWYTPPGVALAVSVILKPLVAQLPQVTMLGALAIFDVLQELGAIRVTIKWPNDVRLNGRKVSGVLPEAEWDGGELRGVALGMGVNVRVDFRGTELEQTAISIEPALGRSVDRGELIAMLMKRVDYWSARLGTDELFETWKSRLETLGQQVLVNRITGLAEDVDTYGALLVRDENGVIQRILAGDVEFCG